MRRSIRLSSVTRYSNFPATKKGQGVVSNSTDKGQTPCLFVTVAKLKSWKIYPFCSKHRWTHSLWFSWSSPYQAGLRFLSQGKTGPRYSQQSAHHCTLLHTKAPHSHLTTRSKLQSSYYLSWNSKQDIHLSFTFFRPLLCPMIAEISRFSPRKCCRTERRSSASRR